MHWKTNITTAERVMLEFLCQNPGLSLEQIGRLRKRKNEVLFKAEEQNREIGEPEIRTAIASEYRLLGLNG